MCGIAGVLGLKGQQPDERVLSEMVQVIHHRGPDDSGFVVNGPCGLGNTRLAIIDLSAAGHQPMHVVHSPTRELDLPPYEAWIAYNGEVYNFAEVRSYLEATRHEFFSHSDTETLLRAYIQYGAPNFIKAFRGMFALAIWDVGRQRLILTRDRLGEKPLYYFQNDEWLVFGSEIKVLLKHPAVPKRLNESLVAHYLAYGYAPAPETMFAGIRQMPPGHMMIVEMRDQAHITLEPYWTPPYPSSDRDDRSEDEIAAELLEQLRSAVTMRMIADVPLGAFLSGGVDSAAIVALMAKESHQAIKTFSIGFAGEESFDETRFAKQIASRFVTDHHEFIVEPEVIGLVEELVWHHDQPFGDSSAIPTYLVSKLARQHVTVALTGDGGDELFAGYDRFRAAQIASTLDLLPDIAQKALANTLERLPESTDYGGLVRRANRFVRTAGLPLSERYLSWVRYVPEEWVEALIGVSGEQCVQKHYRAAFEGALAGGSDDQIVARLLDVNLRTYLPEDLLVKTDRSSMAVSLEARAPFLDHVLLQFAASIPTSLKIKRGTTKYILKKALRGLLPGAVIDRKKHGFGVPIGAWLRTDLADYAKSTLLSEKAAQRGIFDREAVRQMLDTHMRSQADLGQAIWSLLTFELWMQRYFD
jgi:asparagine synthase (glutamine-hydrolysing)